MPLNLFGIAFGLAGLAGLWSTSSALLGIPAPIAASLWIVAAVAWCVTLVRYLMGARSLRAIRADLRHPVLGPFAALCPIVATLFGERVHAVAPAVGQVWVLVAAAITFAFAAWFIAQLATGGRELEALHSGYFLPTVAGGLICAQSLAGVGFEQLAIGAFATGILFWVLFGAITLNRLAFRSQTPASLVPTLAIFSAPPAVAGNALFAITHAEGRDSVDGMQWAVFGTFLFLLALQLYLVPMYVRTPFTLGFWALTFTAAASARYGVQFAYRAAVPGAPIVAWILTLLATGLIGAVAVASVRVTVRSSRQLSSSRVPA